MRDRLWNMMGDIDEIAERIHDVTNLLRVHSDYGQGNGWDERVISVLNSQADLLEAVELRCEDLHTRMDESVLDLEHGRIGQ